MNTKQNKEFEESFKRYVDDIEEISKLMSNGTFGMIQGIERVKKHFENTFIAGELHALKIKKEVINMN